MKALPCGRLVPEKTDSPDYRQIWRIVDGAVANALAAHPEYLAPGARVTTVRNSIVKRVVGAISGYAEQSAWVRSGSSPADDTAATVSAVAAGEAIPNARLQLAAPHGGQAGMVDQTIPAIASDGGTR